VVATTAGSLLPDIDLPTSAIGRPFFPIASWINPRKIGHRTLTHSLLGVMLFGSLAFVFVWALSAWLPGSAGSYARFLTLGFASHILVDTLNKTGLICSGRLGFVQSFSATSATVSFRPARPTTGS
jgi:inner membrane protein